jgi:hypothetical protein
LHATGRAGDGGWDLGYAALLAPALADPSAQLPAVIATVDTAIDHAGIPVEVVAGYLGARCAAAGNWSPTFTGWPMTSIPPRDRAVDTPSHRRRGINRSIRITHRVELIYATLSR